MKTIKVKRDGRPATAEELQCAVAGKPLPPLTGYADVGQPKPTMESLFGPQALAIHKLEERAKGLEELCGQIIATLRVNRLRETLISADDEQLDEMIEAWSRRLHALP